MGILDKLLEDINNILNDLTEEEFLELVEEANKRAYDIYVSRNIEAINKMLEEDIYGSNRD